MKSVRLTRILIAAALGVALALGAYARLGRAAEGLWKTDFKAALAKAKEEKKYLLVDFTGSDWCPYCIKLHNEVFDKAPFAAEAPKQFILVELDFPQQKELSPELKKQNEELRDKYEIEGFPTVLVMDAEGHVIAKTGYRDGGPEPYLKRLAEIPKTYQEVIALKAKLDKTQGLDRAKLLDELIGDNEKLGIESKETETWAKEIIALDPDNKAGLKIKYEFPLKLAEAETLMKSGKLAEARELLDKALALPGVPAELRQEGLMLKGQLCLLNKKIADAVAAIKEARAAAPASERIKHIDDAIERFSKVADAQAAAEKLEAGLAKSEGLDRAKLLDTLIDAKLKLIQFDPEAGASIEKWTKEIIALDAENKAGLKKKYQFKTAIADAEELVRAGKTDEASAALDKALETPGIGGDEIQQGEFLKASFAMMKGNREDAAAHLKKALEAAPTGKYAPVIQMRLQQIEKAAKPEAKKAAGE